MGKKSRDKALQRLRREEPRESQLEWLLRYWEACTMLDRAGELYQWRYCLGREPCSWGPLANWGKFRSYLLSSRPEAGFDFAGFGCVDPHARVMNTHAPIAMALHTWTRFSRRVYHLSTDLQLLLSATEFAALKWSDLHFPFEGFAVTVEDPIPCAGQMYDTFVFGRTERIEGNAPITMLTAVSKDIRVFTEPFHRISGRLLAAAESGHKTQEEVLRAEYTRHAGRYSAKQDEFMVWVLPDVPPDKLVSEVVRELTDKYQTRYGQRLGKFAELFPSLLRIVLGLPAYLGLVLGDSAKRAQFTKYLPSQASEFCTSSISDGADVCRVSSVRTLTPEERHLLKLRMRDPEDFERRAGSEFKIHFRTAHWRRPPGSGHDPKAEKTVWVTWTIVRRDKLSADKAPHGSTNKLGTD